MFEKFQGAKAMSTESVGYHIPCIPCQAQKLNTLIEHSYERSIITCEFFFTLKRLYELFSLSTKQS